MRRHADKLAFWLGWAWPLRLLDKFLPRFGYGGHPAPRIRVFSEAEARRVEEILRRRREREAKQCH